MNLEKYEIEILMRLYRKGIIYTDYKPIEVVERIVNWRQISRDFKVKKKFKTVKRRLLNRSYVYDAGKSCQVASITKHGIFLVEGILDNGFKI